MTELVMTPKTIHRADCNYVINSAVAAPWQWAEGRANVEIRMKATMLGVKLCRMCKPASGAGVVGGAS
jgi:hypothetical protein